MSKPDRSIDPRILEAAKEEFLSLGFEKASTTSICRKAGVTTGALYKRYAGKEELFSALVKPVDGLFEQYKEAEDAHFALLPEGKTSETMNLSAEYMSGFVDYIYDNYDAFKLVLCCSEGTKYSNFIHDLVELDVEQTQRYFSELEKKGKLKGHISPELHHMITSACYTALFETVVHDMSREQAKEYVKELTVFFRSGWESLISFL